MFVYNGWYSQESIKYDGDLFYCLKLLKNLIYLLEPIQTCLLKLHEGEFCKKNMGKEYVVDSFDYFDLCEADRMSLLELISMCKECRQQGVYIFFISGQPILDTNAQILEMSELLQPIKIIYVYPITTEHLEDGDGVSIQEFASLHNQNFEYVDPIKDQP